MTPDLRSRFEAALGKALAVEQELRGMIVGKGWADDEVALERAIRQLASRLAAAVGE